MKQFLVLIVIVINLISCQKDNLHREVNTIERQQVNSYTLKSGDDDDDDDDDEDEEEGECCRFIYGEWQTCSNNYQVRSWRASSTTCQPPLDSIQRQCASADVYYLYYNPQYLSLRVVTNADGFLRIYNNDNQITAVLPYMAGARWVSVSFLPIGTYKVETYGFVRFFNR